MPTHGWVSEWVESEENDVRLWQADPGAGRRLVLGRRRAPPELRRWQGYICAMRI